MKISVAKLEVQMEHVIESVRKLDLKVAAHNEDLLTHDMELEQALNALKLKRARRQPLRDWE